MSSLLTTEDNGAVSSAASSNHSSTLDASVDRGTARVDQPRHHHAYAASDATGEKKYASTREEMLARGISWPIAGWLIIIHASLLFAPFCFSWSGLALCVAFHWLTGGIGVCLGYHRLLTHQSFKCGHPLRYILAAIGGLSGEGSSLHWVANHRKHHAHSDHEGDPHSPHDGPWWSHIWWTAVNLPEDFEETHFKRWIPDMMQDKGLIFLDKMFLPIHIVAGLLFIAAGYAVGGWPLAISWLVWGMFVRLAFVLHSTWFVNSASHMWGYRNYETTDDSRNNWWVALLTYGEGWHNNHHAYPRMARHGHKWWEVDMTFMTIRGLERLGLAWDVVDHQHKGREDGNTIVVQDRPQYETADILAAHGFSPSAPSAKSGSAAKSASAASE